MFSVKKLSEMFDLTGPAGFLLEAGSRVPAPVYFEQSTRLLKV